MPLVLVLVQHIVVQQFKQHVLAIVTLVLVLVQHIAAQQMPVYVLATVTSVQALVQHIAVQQVMLYAQIQWRHVAVQEAEQSLIVLYVLPPIHMVYAVIQFAVVIFAVKHLTTVGRARPAKPVVVGLVILSLLGLRDTAVLRLTIAATGMVIVRHQHIPALVKLIILSQGMVSALAGPLPTCAAC